MKNKITITVGFLIVSFLWCTLPMQAINVTLTIDENMVQPLGLAAAEQNLAQVLTEINRAQKAKEPISVKNLVMDDFAKNSIARLWAATPFYCDDDEVVDRCWVFKDGSMMCSHIPLIITPTDESFGSGTYQEGVIEFDHNGKITDFRLALDAQTSESLEKCGSVADKEKQMIILQYVERFRTAYNQKDLQTISDMFSDDALIITGHIVMRKQTSDSQKATAKVEYTRQNKEQYIRNLSLAFKRNKWIDVKFSQIGENGEEGGCAGITRSTKDPTKYGVRLRQSWKSNNYSDEGYLFLLWEFPENGSSPIIHVRTWQPEWASGKKQEPNDDISTLGGFDL
jgi:hypothetical protein